MNEFFENLLSFGGKGDLKKLRKITDKVNALEPYLSGLEDEDFKEETKALQERFDNGESLDSLLPEAFAIVREASLRVLGMRHFDVQIMGGIALHNGAITEIKTGEGKTLVAILPAYLNALTGDNVHIVTVNEYLAKYQSELMGRVFSFLGMSTGCLLASQDIPTKQEQYACDVVYGTSSEFGFDYLKDNLSQSKEDQVQRGHNFVIIDEIDSILIDDARTPLIISGEGNTEEARWYTPISKIVKGMQEGIDYESDYKKKTVSVLPPAIDKVESALKLDNLYAGENTFLVGAVQNAIKAKALYFRDVDYIVDRDGVQIVDENTGRVLEGRRYNDGLHQAIEAKEGIAIQPEDQTVASVTLQNFFRLYKRMSGMTGTAKTEGEEFYTIYRMPVISIPTNKPNIRIDSPDIVFRNEKHKFNAVVEEISARHNAGQPILVGTFSIEKSELLSRLLKKEGIPHIVLNAKDDSREAEVVAQAGRLGAVTVSTNMAGRGTDIMLGGNAEMLAVAEQKRYRKDDPNAPTFGELLNKFKEQADVEGDKVREVGGLCVIGTERHESKRIDNQLRGRAARQGDPGESIFFLSLEDDLIRKFGGVYSGTVEKIDEAGAIGEEFTKIFTRAQKEAELKSREERKDVVKFDNIVNFQRIVTYEERQRIIEGADLSDKVKEFISYTLKDIIVQYIGDQAHFDEPEHLKPLWHRLEEIYPVGITVEEVSEEARSVKDTNYKWVEEEILSDALLAYQRRASEIGEETLREVERGLILSAIDTHWKHHINNMDALMDVINFRSYAQEEPVNAYRREGNDFYSDMLKEIREEVVSLVFKTNAKSAAELLRGYGEIKLLTQPTIFKLNDSMVQRTVLPTAVDYDGKLIEPDSFFDDAVPMNRAERRAAEKANKKNNS